MLLLTSALHAQTPAKFKIAGLVKDTSGTGIPGVSVYFANNRAVGTATDSDGKFVIEAANGDVIVLSSIGFMEQRFTANANDRQVSFRLRPSEGSISEVVVTAFGKRNAGRPW
ncbi:carboxypeptidase-like regulatory domain-containing protein [Chitinophaga sedimenti]|uniref:carboxypeptidase-like regulatory domain-containing protein n=1 Tax=Chitinophaga sedimenti TaxID=2033606 RepID=UPI002003AB20|nr:carboxypeptidase-like regulatory domain-containing protein [Chitinophaga sedimenti]MCK7556470.1 carboxypeptidase-like regulatory domain-containing protein [Chitinophaga sedimenti]